MRYDVTIPNVRRTCHPARPSKQTLHHLPPIQRDRTVLAVADVGGAVHAQDVVDGRAEVVGRLIVETTGDVD